VFFFNELFHQAWPFLSKKICASQAAVTSAYDQGVDAFQNLAQLVMF
jgi:hypothetical protein